MRSMKTAKPRSKAAKSKAPKVPKAARKMLSKSKPGGAKVKAPKLAKRKTAKLKTGLLSKAVKKLAKQIPAAIDEAVKKAAVSITSGRKREPGGDSERGFYLRLGDEKQGPINKALVKAAAEEAKMSMNAYATAAVMFVVENGMPAMPPKEEAAAATA